MTRNNNGIYLAQSALTYDAHEAKAKLILYPHTLQ